MIGRFLEKRIGTDIRNEKVRSAYGRAACMIGIGANVLFFALKLIIGMIGNSVAIMADAVNNLSDASSGIVSLIGFHLAGKPADADHPYGHGRFEYLAGLMVAVMILVIGVETMKDSVDRILHPAPVTFSAAMAVVLSGSIAVKIWLAAFNRRIGRKIGSGTLMATADDSRNDVIATSAVLLSMLAGHFTGMALDGFMGAGVAAFILVSGAGLVRDMINPMLGTAPSEEQVEAIRRKLLSYPGVLGAHDLLVHDYGPGRQYASVHIEMDAKADPVASHDMIDGVERDFLREMGLHLVIHYDPVTTDDPRVAAMRRFAASAAKEIHPGMTIHDLRIVPGGRGSNVVFDCVVPYDCTVSAEMIRDLISARVEREYPGYRCVITLENSFVHEA